MSGYNKECENCKNYSACEICGLLEEPEEKLISRADDEHGPAEDWNIITLIIESLPWRVHRLWKKITIQ